MRIRLSSLVAISAAALSGAALFWTSQHAQVADSELARLESSLRHEKKSLHVLRAEWDYLNRPERIEALATRYLKMTAPEVNQLSVSAQGLPDTGAPVTPGRKPSIPVAVRIPAVPQAPVAPEADNAPINSAHDFDDLMKKLDKGDAQ